jgi:dihydrofolate reductase
VDGVMEDPGWAEDYRHGGWTFKLPDPDGMKFKLDETVSAAALLLGRVTYEGFAQAWPGHTDEVGFAAKMNSMPKYVASSTLTEVSWENSHLLEGGVPAAVAALKERVDGDIYVHGSRTLAGTLLRHGLVDTLHLMMFPIVLGSGKRLFPDDLDDAVKLTLRSAQQLATGTQILVYDVD